MLSPEKWRFRSVQSLLFLQFSTYMHRTGFIVKKKQVDIKNYLGIPKNRDFFFSIFKVVYFATQKDALFKKLDIFFFFFQKDIMGQTYLCTKCNYNIKFRYL